MPKRKRTKKQILYDKVWDLMSLYVRKRDQGICITCGDRTWDEQLGEFTIKGMQAGHFKHGVLDFDEININCQCVQCNYYLSGNLSVYALRLIDKYGLDAVKDLETRASKALKGNKMSIEELEAIKLRLEEKIRTL